VTETEDSGFISKALSKTKKPRRNMDLSDQLVIQEPKTVLDGDGDEDSSKRDFMASSGAEFITTFSDDIRSNDNIILNETSEFCRNLGAWQTGGTAKKSEVAQEILDFEESLQGSKSRRRSDDMDIDSDDDYENGVRGGVGSSRGGGNWEEVSKKKDESGSGHTGYLYDRIASGSKAAAVGASGSEKKKSGGSSNVLDDEPDLASNSGVVAALKMARKKGYLMENEKKEQGLGLKHLQAKNYSIDDKVNSREDERGGRRGGRDRRDEDRYGGSTSSFQEKKGYKPNVDLTYMDDTGRMMNQKEAFRYLSHRFHGKGSGKIKTEKRMKKIMEEGAMKNMSSTDTPLNTLQKLKARQSETATPYLILTGNKSNPATDITDIRK